MIGVDSKSSFSNPTRIVGIDPGLQVCGYACLEIDGGRETIVEAGVFRTTRELPLEVKLNQIAEDVDTLLGRFRPDVVAVEQLYSHYAHPRTAILMGHARGVILQKCAAAHIEVMSFAATRIKKSITGNGRASKEQMQRTMQTILGLGELPKPPDVADAMAIALCCANTISRVVPER
ncbi:MAG: crossover junction endodeoxyribonuclease RuvC [Planctomycetes bacterium RBG_13_62_9]|nr:MAG: crossover junction endodeoxyribonuclease RuvC [Planctomycetes bacterium RBG_13_62_9]